MLAQTNGSWFIWVVAGALIVETDSAPMVDATRGLVAGMAVGVRVMRVVPETIPAGSPMASTATT